MIITILIIIVMYIIISALCTRLFKFLNSNLEDEDAVGLALVWPMTALIILMLELFRWIAGV